MAVDANAAVEITAFNWVPPFARGQVRDLRVRWALEEAGIDYAERLFDPRESRPASYLDEQPFDQVPVYRDGALTLFETGAIVLHLGQRCDALLPADPIARARATAWVFAALNSVEPVFQQLASIDLFSTGQAWIAERRPQVVDMVKGKLGRLETRLTRGGGRDWMEDRFTAGDLMMATVLRILGHTDLVAGFPRVAAFKARAEARPALVRAMAAQMAAFAE